MSPLLDCRLQAGIADGSAKAQDFNGSAIWFVVCVLPTPSHLAGILQTMRARAVRIVVREPYQPERDVAFVAGKAGASVVTLAASVGALPQTDDFISLFERDVDALRAAASVQ